MKMGGTGFHTSFLLALPFLKDVPKQKKKKNVRESKNKKKKAGKVVEEIKESVEEKPFDGKMDVGKPTAFVHVEYTILPGILVYDFDIVCFGDVAKIYTRDYNRSVKTIVKGNIAWIPFTIDHNIHMSDELLESLHGATASFYVWHDKKKQFKTTQLDKPKKFCMTEEDINKVRAGTFNTMFVPLDEWDSNAKTINAAVTLPNLCVLVKNSLCSSLYNGHRKTIEGLVNQLSDNLQIIKPEGVGNKKKTKGGTQNMKGKKEKKGKKDKKAKKSPTAGSEQITMLGELFFARILEIKVEKKFESLTIPYMAVIITVDDLLIEDQVEYFNPAIVQIRDINNIPVKLFQKYGFEWIYMTYTLPNDKEYVTEKKRVDKTVSFNDSRVMLTHNLDATKVMEFILSKFLRIKLWGVRDERFCEPIVPDELFRLTLSNRCMLSRLLPDPFNHPYAKTDNEAVRFVKDTISQTVCIAEMEMDISAMAMNQTLVESTNSFRRPRALYEYGSTSGSWAYYNLPDVHEPGRIEPVNTSPFTDFMLQRTTVDVAFKTLAPLTCMMMDVYESKEHYNRIIIVINSPLDGKLCTEIIEEIYKTNLPFVRLLKPPNDLFYARKEFLRPHAGEYSEKITEELQGKQHFYLSRRGKFHTPFFGRSAMTGFILDNCDRVLIVLEGRAQSSLLKIYCYLEELEVSSGFIVHYNSEMAFKTRLYHDFLEMGGIMFITIDEPIEVKQMKKEFILTRSTGGPSRAVHTINKLNNLFRVKDIATACRQDFFPSAMHLVSFALEFGIPFRLIDDYTEPPTPPEYRNVVLMEDDDGTLSNYKSFDLNVTDDKNREDTASIGFEPIFQLGNSTENSILDIDSFFNSPSFHKWHLYDNASLCNSIINSEISCRIASSLKDIGMSKSSVVPKGKNAAGHETFGEEIILESSAEDVLSNECSHSNVDSKPNRVVSAKKQAVKKQAAKKQLKDVKTSDNFPNHNLSNKQLNASKQKNISPSIILSNKQSKESRLIYKSSSVILPNKQSEMSKLSENSRSLILPDKHFKDSRLYNNLPSLILHRKQLQNSYTGASSPSSIFAKIDEQNQNIEIDQTPKTPPEPPCPIQVKYFRDFYSGKASTKKHAERKSNQTQVFSKSPDHTQEKVNEFLIHKDISAKNQIKIPVRKKRLENHSKKTKISTEQLFPKEKPSENFSDIRNETSDSPSMKRAKKLKKSVKRTKKEPTTPPEPPCPLQEFYFKDYYESTTFH